MVGGAGQRQPLFQGALKEGTELLLRRQQDGEVVEAGGVLRARLTAGKQCEAQKCMAAHAQQCMFAVSAHASETEPFVERDLTLEVEDLQVDSTERPVRQSSACAGPAGQSVPVVGAFGARCARWFDGDTLRSIPNGDQGTEEINRSVDHGNTRQARYVDLIRRRIRRHAKR